MLSNAFLPSRLSQAIAKHLNVYGMELVWEDQPAKITRERRERFRSEAEQWLLSGADIRPLSGVLAFLKILFI